MHKLNQIKLKAGWWAFYAIWPENRSGIFYSSRGPAWGDILWYTAGSSQRSTDAATAATV